MVWILKKSWRFMCVYHFHRCFFVNISKNSKVYYINSSVTFNWSSRNSYRVNTIWDISEACVSRVRACLRASVRAFWPDASCRGCHRVRSLFINRSFKFCRETRAWLAARGEIYDDPSHEMHTYIIHRDPLVLFSRLAPPRLARGNFFHLVISHNIHRRNTSLAS